MAINILIKKTGPYVLSGDLSQLEIADADGKKVDISGPRVETKDWLISVGSQPEFASSLDRALQMATTDMVRWLVEDYGIEPWAAHLLIGYQARYDVVTVAGSMALRIPRQRLPAGK